MEERSFTFHISNYDIHKLRHQLSLALEKRSALLSRERFPQLWSVTDKLNAQNEARHYQPVLSRGKSILFLLLGIVLAVPGLMNPQERLVLLLFGIVGIFAGIRGLLDTGNRMIKRMKKRFDLSAKQLLAGKERLTEKDLIDITFSEEGISFPAGENERETISFDSFESVIEAEDLYLLVFESNVIVLQKADLLGGDFTSFHLFLGQKVARFIPKEE
ncbi:MAG: hypothetical protein IKV99_05065 [Oscillospiraceae bacterium]|nr:hypothetical protein [Oscillospiraceae bacterium]